jgi:hypothetical protein
VILDRKIGLLFGLLLRILLRRLLRPLLLVEWIETELGTRQKSAMQCRVVRRGAAIVMVV